MDYELQSLWAGATALLTLGLLVATSIYAWLTHKLVIASEQQAWEISRPRVVVALRTNQGGQFIVLEIENIGPTAAEELTLVLDRPLHQQFGSNDDVGEIPILKEGVPAFPPRTRVRIGLGVAHAYLAESVDREKHPLTFTVSASYRSGSRSITEAFPLDIHRQLNSTLMDRDYIEDFSRTFPDKFAKEMRDLAKAVKSRSV